MASLMIMYPTIHGARAVPAIRTCTFAPITRASASSGSPVEGSLAASIFQFENEFRPSLRKGKKLTVLTDSEHSFSFGNSSYSSDDDDDYDDAMSPPEEELSWAELVASETEEGTGSDTPITYHGSKPFDRLDFARVYDVAALRVPASESRSLEHRLRGHLLNWPRISNVARVDGDDLDDHTKGMLMKNGHGAKEEGIDSVLRAIYGTMKAPSELAERAEVVNKFRSQGSVHFQRLERMSRPSHKALQRRKKGRGNTMKGYKDKFYMVELCEDKSNMFEVSLERISFGTKRWMGPSRLLLLDTKYTGKPASELPMAVQVLLKGNLACSKGRPKREIVSCKLTLFYNYWSLEEILNELLPEGDLRPSDIAIFGHIGFVELTQSSISLKHSIGKVILDKQWPKIKTVVSKPNIMGAPLEVLAGNHSLVTTVMENGFLFHINMATMCWNSDLEVDRRRLLARFSHKDVVCDVSAGVGALVVPAAKKVWRVFANESNAHVVRYLARNVAESQMQSKIEIYNLDGRAFIKRLLGFSKPPPMTQLIVSCLSRESEEFLDALKGAFNPLTWKICQPMPIIHLYGSSHALDPEVDFLERTVCRLGHTPERVEMCRVMLMKSGDWMLRATFQLPRDAAFSN